MSSILIIDLETQNHEYYGRKATPYCPDNYVVESGWRIDRDGVVGEINSVRFESLADFKNASPKDWLPIPSDCWCIVAHNAAYEISWFLQHARAQFENFLRQGGRVYCTMHGEYLITDQTSLYPSLDETAPKYGGTHKVDGVKLLWEKGVLTSEIDPVLLHEYLTGENGDIANTALLFYAQIQKFTEQGRVNLIWERMRAILAFAYCEWFGLFVNMPIAKQNMQENSARIKEIKQELNKYLPNDLPFEFNWSSDYHVSALLFGGAIKYVTKVSYNPPKFEKYDAYKHIETGEYVPIEREHPPGEVLNFEVYKSGKYKGEFKVYRVDSSIEKLKNTDALFNFDGLVNIEELPPVLREKYIGKKAEYIGKRALPCGNPVYSTSSEAMMGLSTHGFDFASLIVELMAIEKDMGTYYLQTDFNKDGSVKKISGMLQYVIPSSDDGSGIIHHSLNTSATSTGRLSSSSPNLQNLPRGGTSKLKQVFTSRFGENGRIAEIDYSSLEVVMNCVLSGDKELLRLLSEGVDMHCYRLAFDTGVPYEEVLRYCKDESLPDHKAWVEKRTAIKTKTFAAQYGANASGIAFNTGCSLESAERFLENEARLFPDSIKFRSIIRKEVERTGNFSSNTFREQAEDGSFRIYHRGYYQAPSGMRYSFRQHQQWRDGKYIMDYKDTQLANYWCQGESFLMMAIAFGEIIYHLVKNNFYDNKVCLINNVHDAAYIDAANEEIAIEAALDIKKIMQDTRLRMLKVFGKYGIMDIVKFPAVAEVGTSMFDKHPI